MTTARARLTDQDIRRLVRGDAEEDRAVAAHKLCRAIERTALTADERAAAQDILRVLAADAAELVRRALAVTLKASTLISRDIALRLAADVDSIALPVIMASPAFTDEDLIEIVRTARPAAQLALAQREQLSERVCIAIAEEAAEPAVRLACANDNARFGEAALARAIDRFPGEGVAAAVALRSALPPTIVERLLQGATEAVRERLVARYKLAPVTAETLSIATRERATADLVDQAASSADIEAFVVHLGRQGRLTPSLLVRALGRGQMGFFEHAVAVLSDVPFERTWLMIHDAGPLGLKAICERAGLPRRLYGAYRAGVDAWRALNAEGAWIDPGHLQSLMLQRFLTLSAPVSSEDLAYLSERLDQPAEPCLVHANAA